MNKITQDETYSGMIGNLKYFLYGSFVYLDIDLDVYKVLMIFMLIDTFFGVLKVLKIDYIKFSVKMLIWGIVSKITLLLFPLLVALLGKSIGDDLGLGVDIVMRLLIVGEFISALSNIYTVKTGLVVKDIDVFSMTFKFIRAKAMGYIEKISDKKNSEDL